MNKKKSLTINSIFYLFYNVINLVFPFISGIYVTHVLLPDTIGVVEIARNLTQYFVTFSFLGIPTYGLREISKFKNEKNKLNKVYSELMIINFCSTVFFFIIYISIVILVPEYRENIVLFLVVGISIVLNIFNNSWLFEGLEEFGYIAIRNLIFKVFSFILLISLVKGSDDYLIYAAIAVIGTAGNYILNIINSNKFVRLTFKSLNFKQHLKPIIYLVVVNLAIEIYSLVDITMLGFMSDRKNVAFYTYAIRVYKILLQIINSFTMVLVPRITLYYKENKINEYNMVISKTLKAILLLSIPMVIGIFYTSDYLVCLIYGSEYIRSSYVLKIVSSIIIISPIGYLLGNRMCLVTDNEKKMIIPVVCGAIINLVLNYILIPKYNEIGAAIASLISEIVVMIIYINIGKKYFRLINMKTLYIKEGIALIGLTFFLSVTSILSIENPIKTIVQIVFSIFIYFLILILLKEEFVYSKFKNIERKVIRK